MALSSAAAISSTFVPTYAPFLTVAVSRSRSLSRISVPRTITTASTGNAAASMSVAEDDPVDDVVDGWTFGVIDGWTLGEDARVAVVAAGLVAFAVAMGAVLAGRDVPTDARTLLTDLAVVAGLTASRDEARCLGGDGGGNGGGAGDGGGGDGETSLLVWCTAHGTPTFW